jgi:ABC-type multidrug transport system fused ATPase/permease subunit
MKSITKFIKRSFSILNKKDRKHFIIFVAFQSLMSVLDLIGIAVVGLIGLVAINGYSGSSGSGFTSHLIELTNLNQVTFFTRIIILCFIATIILLTRTVITIYVTKKGLLFLARVTSDITADSFSKFLTLPFPEIQRIPSQETIFLLTTGINKLILGVLGAAIVLITDGFLIVLIVASLLIIDLKLAVSSLTLFLVVGLILRKFSGNKSTHLSRSIAVSEISINSLMKETLENYRELSVKNSTSRYVDKVGKLSKLAMGNDAEIAFLPLSSKYVIEFSLIVVSFLLAGFQFVVNDAKTAISTLALFMAASARVMPAVLRIQQSILSIQASVGTSERTWILFSKINSHKQKPLKKNEQTKSVTGSFSANIELREVEYSHPDNHVFRLKIGKLSLRSGEQVAIVGASGSGKSTLADLILGVLLPDKGEILIDGRNPSEIVKVYPGSISYVPQKVFISNSSVRDNVTLGFEGQEIVDQKILQVLSNVKLTDWLSSLNGDLDSKVGEAGYSMSGGQQQRLGIARALYSDPRLLVMDEATSALDAETEKSISETINGLTGRVTVIMIAHRLSTVRNADRVVYLQDGEIIADGTFEHVRGQVPNFDRQALLMGL